MVDNQQAAHKRLTLTQKHDIVPRLQEGNSPTNIAKDYGVKKQAISYIRTQSDNIILEGNVSKKAKFPMTAENYVEADQILNTWFLNMRAENKEINSCSLLASFKKIEQRKSRVAPSESTSESCVQPWRERHMITFKGYHRESLDCPDYSEFLKQSCSIVCKLVKRFPFLDNK